ncbi:hypothetical protein A6A04_14650 [Paramagnetospirillum marisnigri]|uniref:DUF2325 domain-containing protein n=1 Tax=Paramagnetospirillum marisnigri TaxID=1285242 RepID=A0A178MVV3_9PROT|nr:DUF2325 domain-containing protein [Paramagnetospirillum marisnigri]OAN53189.1 hypothetical protein A6A04_14650 [Paramagnetospirillum marisnigri]
MCEQCIQTTSDSPALPRRRLKLWEIDSQWHCTIIGTCLSLGELKGAASRLRLRLPSEKPSDHEIHTSMIVLIGREKLVAKMLNKMLDRKHAAAIGRFARLEGEAALAEAWRDMLAKGDVASACWAVMSHPETGEKLRNEVFGDIHMLSHQVGAASRADLRQVHALEQEKSELEARLSRQQERMRSEIGRRNTMIREMRRRLDGEIAEGRRLAHAARAAEELDRLRLMMSDIQDRLDREQDRRRSAEGQKRDTLLKLRDLGEHLAQVLQESTDLKAELAASEARLSRQLDGGDRLGECSADCAGLDLCGRCILFVGGRSQHVPHFRKLVEECNGTFAHHDGGFEESMTRLHGLFGRADAVLFPVDCVSHSAHDEVKRLCRRWEKPFVPVRHSGLGAFLKALASVAAPEGGIAG